MSLLNLIEMLEFDWKTMLPVSRGGWVVVEEGEHVQLEGVVLLPDSNKVNTLRGSPQSLSYF